MVNLSLAAKFKPISRRSQKKTSESSFTVDIGNQPQVTRFGYSSLGEGVEYFDLYFYLKSPYPTLLSVKHS